MRNDCRILRFKNPRGVRYLDAVLAEAELLASHDRRIDEVHAEGVCSHEIWRVSMMRRKDTQKSAQGVEMQQASGRNDSTLEGGKSTVMSARPHSQILKAASPRVYLVLVGADNDHGVCVCVCVGNKPSAFLKI